MSALTGRDPSYVAAVLPALKLAMRTNFGAERPLYCLPTTCSSPASPAR